MDHAISAAQRGAASELLACAHLVDQGFHVYRSVAATAPFDLVAYRDGESMRVEVKTLHHYPEKRATGPNFVWPRNDEWDLLVVVDPASGRCFEITGRVQWVAAEWVRSHYREAPIPA